MAQPAEIARVVRAMVDRLVAAYAPDKIILFGSYAYGVPGSESDVDLLVIKDTPEPFLDRLEAVRKAVGGTHARVPFEPIVLTPTELDQRLNKGDQFLDEIVKRGEVLYAR